MRAITTATAAVILGIERKALDNMLARIDEEVLPKGRQGVERRIPVSLLERLAITADLAATMGAPVREAYRVARFLTDPVAGQGSDPASAPVPAAGGRRETVEALLGPHLRLAVDLAALRRDIQDRAELAIESVVRRRRGRPRRSRG